MLMPGKKSDKFVFLLSTYSYLCKEFTSVAT